MFSAGQPLTTYNLGVRGDTSGDVAARWRAEAQARMGDAEPSYGVVFGLGTNDTSEEGGGVRVEPRLAVDNLSRMIAAARVMGLDVFGGTDAGGRACAGRARMRAFTALRAARARSGRPVR